MQFRPTTFATYNWFPEKGTDLIHPDDLVRFVAINPAGRLFGYARVGDWIVLSTGEEEFRVRDALLQPVPSPRYWIGDVATYRSSREERRGTIRQISWHVRDGTPIYLLTADGRGLRKRYQESDLSTSPKDAVKLPEIDQ